MSAEQLPQPAWIQMLFKKAIGSGYFDTYNVKVHQRRTREYVENLCTGLPERAGELRDVSIRGLKSDDLRTIKCCLSFLMIVGQESDIEAVERLLGHSDETIRKAAKTCQFQLSRG